jgi:hypothetical protein
MKTGKPSLAPLDCNPTNFPIDLQEKFREKVPRDSRNVPRDDKFNKTAYNWISEQFETI